MKKSVGALIVHDKKLLMLLRDNKSDIPDPNCWQLIGGELEKNETTREALIREIKEETNLQISKDKPIKIGKVVIFGRQEYFLYWINLPEDKVGDIKLGNEGQRLGFFSIEEIVQMNLGQVVSVYFQKFKEGLKNIVENEALDRKALGFNEDRILKI